MVPYSKVSNSRAKEEPPPITKPIRLKHVAQARAVAEKWGISVELKRPWENRVTNLSMPDSRRCPIDKEDARAMDRDGNAYTRNAKFTADSQMKAQSPLNNSPMMYTSPVATKEQREELAIQAAEAEYSDAAKGEKVAVLKALIGEDIASTFNQDPTSLHMVRQ